MSRELDLSEAALAISPTSVSPPPPKRCPAELDHAAKHKLGHTAFLERLLDVEVAATEARRHAGLERFASLPGAVAARRLRLRRPTLRRPRPGQRARHPALLGGRHQRVVHRPARRRQDDARRRSRPRLRRRRLPHLLHHRRRPRRPLPPRRPRRTLGHHHALLRRTATAGHRRSRLPPARRPKPPPPCSRSSPSATSSPRS